MPFRDVIGHHALRLLLSRAVSRGTLPQSLIFTGPDGTGKRLTAIGVAQLINCTQRITSPDVDAAAGADALPIDACGVCPGCRRIALGTHPDVLLLEAGIGIDDIRVAIESSGYRPFEGRHRVVVLNDADRLSGEIQNALLKTLEEPPPSSSFILVTSRPELLLLTVRSRCPMLRFGRLSVADLERFLREKQGLAAPEARAAALAADGSVTRAIAAASDEGPALRDLVEQLLHHVQAARSPADRLRVAGLLLEPSLTPSTGTRSKARGKPVSKAASERELISQRLTALGAALRDLAAVGSGADVARLSTAPTPALQGMVRGYGADRLLAAFDAVGRAQQAIDRNVSPKTVADWLVFQI